MIRTFLLLALSLVAPIATAADDAIQWPVTWRAGAVVGYSYVGATEETGGGERSVYRLSSAGEARISSVSPSGFVQTWTTDDSQIEVLEGDASYADKMRPLFELTDGTETSVDLDASGRLVRVHVDPALSARLVATARPAFESMMRANIDRLPEGERNEWLLRLDRLVDSMLETHMGVAAMEATQRESLDLFTAFSGRTFERGHRYETPSTFYDTDCGTVPARLSFWVDATDTKSKDATLMFRREALPDAGNAACAPSAYQQVEEGSIVFDRATGIVESLDTRSTMTREDYRRVITGQTKRVR